MLRHATYKVLLMVELPETHVLSKQISQELTGKTILNVTVNANPHKFAWYSGMSHSGEQQTDISDLYNKRLAGRKITGANPGTGYTCGGNTEIICDDMLLVISTPIKYHGPGGKLPAKHQLLVEFDDSSHMSCTVQMWGSMLCYSLSENELPEDFAANRRPDPLTDDFNEAYFERLWRDEKPSLSAKALLATEQRIPGLGNGVLQDILFNARIHPKRKLQTMGDADMEKLFSSIKSTLKDMKDYGGRDTERDLFNRNGEYQTILSKNTVKYPCRVCGWDLVRQAYMGGNIYFCPVCQPLGG